MLIGDRLTARVTLHNTSTTTRTGMLRIRLARTPPAGHRAWPDRRPIPTRSTR
jgi:hypothetical protein